MVENKFKWTLRASEHQGQLRLQWNTDHIPGKENQIPINIQNAQVWIYNNVKAFPPIPDPKLPKIYAWAHEHKDINYRESNNYGHTWDTKLLYGTGWYCAIVGLRGDGELVYVNTIITDKDEPVFDTNEYEWFIKASAYETPSKPGKYLKLEWDSHIKPWPRALEGRIHVYNFGVKDFPDNPLAETELYKIDNECRNPHGPGFVCETNLPWSTNWHIASIAKDENGNYRYNCKLVTDSKMGPNVTLKEEAMFV